MGAGGAANPMTRVGAAQQADAAYADAQRESKIFDAEISYQLKMKIQDKLYFEKRENSDYLKPSRSENVMFRSQVANIDETVALLEKDNEWLLNAGNELDGGQALSSED